MDKNYIPVQYLELSKKIEDFINVNKAKKSQPLFMLPGNRDADSDPLESAAIYLSLGVIDGATMAIDSILNETVSFTENENLSYLIERKADIISFSEELEKLPPFTMPKPQPWYKRFFQKV